MPAARPTDVRFWEKVDKRGPDECWPWLAYRRPQGYGQFDARRELGMAGSTPAQRVAWVLAYGTSPVGQVVRHTCDNPPCCNPAHLELGTIADNNHDRKLRGQYAHSPDAKLERGERHHNARLTEATVLEIRERYTGTWGEQAALSREYGIKSGVINEIVKGIAWAHVGGPRGDAGRATSTAAVGIYEVATKPIIAKVNE